MLTKRLAERIVRETMKRLQRNMNVMDEDGVILASGEAGRVGQTHPAAIEAMRANRVVVVDEREAERWGDAARTGVNLPVVHHGRVVGAIGVTGRPEEVRPFGELVKMTTELMIEQHEQTMLEERRRRAEVELIAEWIEAGAPDPGRVDRLARRLRFSPTPPYHAALIALPAGTEEGAAEEAWVRACRTVFSSNEALVGPVPPGKLIVLTSGSATEETRRKLLCLRDRLARLSGHAAEPPPIFLGAPAETESGIRAAYREAELAAALTAGSSPAPGRGPDSDSAAIVDFRRIETDALAFEMNEQRRARLFEKLRPHWNEKIQETLRCLFDADLNIARTAQRLGTHRNTVLYRLEQVREKTGYDPLTFRDAIALQFMVRFVEWGESSANSGR